MSETAIAPPASPPPPASADAAPPPPSTDAGLDAGVPLPAEVLLESPIATNHDNLPIDERIYLDRRPAVQAAVDNLLKARTELAAAIVEKAKASKTVTTKEAAVEAATDAMLIAFQGGASLAETPLFDEAQSDEADAQEDWDTTFENWLQEPVTMLNLSNDVRMIFEVNAITTLGHIKALQSDPANVMGLRKLQGIGEEREKEIETAFDAAMEEFLKNYPSPRAQDAQAETTAAVPTPAAEAPAGATPSTPDDQPKFFDFETTFPTPIDPTDRKVKKYCENHGKMIADLLAAQVELSGFREELDGNMTAAKRRKAETTAGELTLFIDGEFEAYQTVFGNDAVGQLRAYIRDKSAAKANLKGGL